MWVNWTTTEPTDNTERVYMNYLIGPDVSEETEERETDPLTGNIIGAVIDIHRALGPGLLESAYEACLIYELRLRSCTKT